MRGTRDRERSEANREAANGSRDALSARSRVLLMRTEMPCRRAKAGPRAAGSAGSSSPRPRSATAGPAFVHVGGWLSRVSRSSNRLVAVSSGATTPKRFVSVLAPSNCPSADEHWPRWELMRS
jgi:hypothetical protein